jgi:hypothetical protein
VGRNGAKRRFLEQPEEFEDDHDNDNHSNYVKDVLFMPATHIRVSVRWPALSRLSGSWKYAAWEIHPVMKLETR